MKRIYLFNIVAWNYRKKIGFPVCKKENFAGLQAHRKRGKSARASPTPHHTLNEERSARFTAQHLSALLGSWCTRDSHEVRVTLAPWKPDFEKKKAKRLFCNPAVCRAQEILSIVCLSLAPCPLTVQFSALPTEIGRPYVRIGCIMCQLFTWFLTPGINHITL